MKQAIVVGAYHKNREALDLLLGSLEGTKWPVFIVVSGAGEADAAFLFRLHARAAEWDWHVIESTVDCFELGCLKLMLGLTDVEEMLFLQDTFEILDQSILDMVFEYAGSVALGPGFFHYAGKWRRVVLEQLDIPTVRSKKDSVHWEHTFGRLYWQACEQFGDPIIAWDMNFHDGAHKGFVERFGRTNMVLENRWYRKLKGDWGQRPL